MYRHSNLNYELVSHISCLEIDSTITKLRRCAVIVSHGIGTCHASSRDGDARVDALSTLWLVDDYGRVQPQVFRVAIDRYRSFQTFGAALRFMQAC